MALAKCKECGNEVATSAKTCPKCGAPAPKAGSFALGCLTILAIVGVLAAIGSSMKSKPATTSAAAAAVPVAPPQDVPAAQVQPAAATEQPTMAVELPALLSEYHDNELRADGQFKDQTIRTTGYVDDVKKDLMGDAYIVLGTGKQFEMPMLQCTLADDQATAAARLKKGQQIALKGRVTGLMMHVQAKDCVLLSH